MNVSIDFTEVTVGEVTIWFSYRTPVGFMAPGWGRVVRENVWGPTTGKHLNYISTSSRVDGISFEIMLELALAGKVPEPTLA